MREHTYDANGDAFLGDLALGRAGVALVGLETNRGRQADGSITFEDTPEHDVVGRRLTFIPDDGYGPFDVVVTAIRNGRIVVASDGAMPWWQ